MWAGLTFVTNVTKDVNRDTDVMGDERLVCEWHECVEAFEESEDDGEE